MADASAGSEGAEEIGQAQEIVEHVTAIDIAKASGMVCIRLPHLESRGLECRLVNARDVKNVPGRPKTDKLDAI